MVILCNLGVGVFYVNYLEAQILKEEVSSSNNELISIYLGDTEGNYTYSTESSFPTTGYEYNEEKSYCVNESTLSWNGSQITVNTIGSDNCYVYFDEIQTVYLANYVIDLVNTTQGEGEVVYENGYRYEGSDPNNYVTFNDQTWRIIGVFETDVVNDDGSTTQESLVKIVKDESIGSYTWDNVNTGDGVTYTNNWPTSDLYNLLNGAYYKGENGTNSVADNSYCWSGYSSAGTCDFTTNGINDNYRGYIENVIWELGGVSAISTKAENFYKAERGLNGYSTGTSTAVTYSTTTEGYVGLIYMSDYGYAALADTCTRETDLVFAGSGCYDENWLYTGSTYWTIVPNSSSSNYVWCVDSTGYATYSTSISAFGVVPVLYLKSVVEIVSGTGEDGDPYILSM